MTILAFLVVACVVGALIGAVGVGGVLLAPALVIAGGQDAQAATAVSSWVFIFTGIAGTWRYGRQGSIPWPLVSRVAVGVVPLALAGAFVNRLLPGNIVLVLVAAIAFFSGLTTLWASPRRAPQPIGSSVLMGLGAAVGFGSAVTGTGGPILLMPALLVGGIGARAAVAASQVLQLPIVTVASAGFLILDGVQIALGSVLGLAGALGVLGGSAMARRTEVHRLRVAVGVTSCLTGLLLFARSIAS